MLDLDASQPLRALDGLRLLAAAQSGAYFGAGCRGGGDFLFDLDGRCLGRFLLGQAFDRSNGWLLVRCMREGCGSGWTRSSSVGFLNKNIEHYLTN